jgi:hypothetical protein
MPVTSHSTTPVERRSGSTAWAGMALFGGVMMVLVGGFHILQGFAAIVRDEYYLVTRDGLLITMDYTAWGWTHLLLGLVAVATGFGVMLAQRWARVAGIVIAVISAVANIAFLSAYPLWSTMVIAFDVLVIYALAAHGRELGTL